MRRGLWTMNSAVCSSRSLLCRRQFLRCRFYQPIRNGNKFTNAEVLVGKWNQVVAVCAEVCCRVASGLFQNISVIFLNVSKAIAIVVA